MWKKALKIGGIVVGVLIAGVLVAAATRPDTFRVSRSLAMAAPPEAVFANLEDFRRWPRWSPWEGLDPAMQRTYGGPPSGVGATYGWSGNDDVGKGKMTIVESRPAKLLGIRLEFLEPWAATNHTEFQLTPAGTATRVTWTMDGQSNYVTKIFTLFMDMDSMIGKDFEKGLAKLKTVSEGE